MQDLNPATESMPRCHELQASTFPQPLMGGSDPTRLNHAKTTELLWIAGVDSGLWKCVSPMFTSLSLQHLQSYLYDSICVPMRVPSLPTTCRFCYFLYPPFHMTWSKLESNSWYQPEVVCFARCWASVFTTIEVKDHVNGHWITKHQTQQVSHDGHLSLSFSFVNCVFLLRL